QTRHAAWSSKRKWVTALAAVVVLAVVLDIATRLMMGSSAASAARRIFTNNALSSSGTSLAASDAEKGEANDFYLRGRYEWNQRCQRA
ncbi:MAG TPA: hypothetical protein VHD85_04160, partial [Terracidiphilus sp.]|nr:hypothetical protein [Terracidiphilus sp.]